MTDAALTASNRCSFQLSYHRSQLVRSISPGLIDGEYIDDAYNPGESTPGEWENGPAMPPFDDATPMTSVSVEEWTDHYASMAVNEAVHEALEWFQVDGEPWLDPHGEHEDMIYELVNELARKLADLRSGRAQD